MTSRTEPMATFGFLITLKIPHSLYEKMNPEDQTYLHDLAKYSSATLTHRKFVFYIGDINRVRSILARNEIKHRFPPAKEMKQYGINYTGDSIEIEKVSDVFVITQYFPDGEVRIHNIPEERVWRVYYMLQRMVEREGRNTFEAKEIWEQIAKTFDMPQFFRDDETFDKSKFNGSRGTYHNFYYYPIKVLEHIGKIEYSKSGKVKLLSKEEMKEWREKQKALA